MIQSKKIYIILLIIFLAVFAGTGLILFLTNSQKSEQGAASTGEQQVILPTAVVKQGLMQLRATGKGDTLRFPRNQNITIQMTIDTNNENIVGWDGLIDYDFNAFNFISATSNIKDFKIYSFKRENHISLTSIKSLESKTPSIFKGELVATVVFQPKQTGVFSIGLKPEIGKEKTDMINTVTKRIYPQLNSLRLEIY